MPLGESWLKECNPQKHFRCQLEALKHISALQLRILKFTEICLSATADTILCGCDPILLVFTDWAFNCKHPWMTLKNGSNMKNGVLFSRLCPEPVRRNSMWSLIGIAADTLAARNLWGLLRKAVLVGKSQGLISQNATGMVAGTACRLTKHGHFGVFSHAAQRWMRVEPDHWGMHEKLSHRDLCDLRERQRRWFKRGRGQREKNNKPDFWLITAVWDTY